MKNINEFNEDISMMVTDYDADYHGDFNDYAYECADGRAYGLCHVDSWKLVELVRTYNNDLFYAGEKLAFDLGTQFESLDQMVFDVASGIIYTAMMDAFNKQVHESDVEKGDES
jgi:hypothetical protein